MIMLKSSKYIVDSIKKKTKAEFFRDVQPGHMLVFSLPMKPAGRCSRGGSYATYVTVTNLMTNTEGCTSLNQLSILENFELREVE